MLLSAVTTPVRASVQTGEPPNLAREGDQIGLTAEAGAGGTPLAGSARPNHAASPRRPGSRLRRPMTGRSGQKVSNFEPGGRPTVQQTAGSGEPPEPPT